MLDQDQMTDKIMGKRSRRDKAFWKEIGTEYACKLYPNINAPFLSAAAVPQRDIKSLTAHVQRNHHPFAKLGEWTPTEDQELAT